MRVLATTGDGTAAPVDAPMPVPGSEEVLVRVDAAAINYVDRFIASGATHELGHPRRPGWARVGRRRARCIGRTRRARDTLQSAFAGGLRGRWIVQPSPSS